MLLTKAGNAHLRPGLDLGLRPEDGVDLEGLAADGSGSEEP